MNNELEELMTAKNATTPVHRGEVHTQPENSPKNESSIIKEVLFAPMSQGIAFAMVLLAAVTVVAGTWHLAPEVELQIALDTPISPTLNHGHGSNRVLGVSDSKPVTLFANIAINGSDSDVTVPAGESVVVSWESDGAKDCNVWPLGLSGITGKGITAPLKQSAVFTVSCNGDTGTQTDTIAVTVPSSGR